MNRELDAAIADANNRLARQGVRCSPGDPTSGERIDSALAARLVGKNPVKTRVDAWLMGLPEGEFLVSTPPVDSVAPVGSVPARWLQRLRAGSALP